MNPLIPAAGALALLAAFGHHLINEAGKVRPLPRLSLAFNAVGSGLLALDAVAEHQPIFVVVEGVWSIASLISLTRTIAPAPDRLSGQEPQAVET